MTSRSICIAVAALACVVVSACVPPARTSIEDAAELRNDQVVIVGRVELVPPLDTQEQQFSRHGMIGGEKLRNKLLLLTHDTWRRLRDDREIADYKGRIEATLGKNFFVQSDNKPFYILLGELWVTLGEDRLDKVYLPGGLKVDVRPGDKAVYIGTLRYYRNEYFHVTSNKVVDDYERANTDFRKKFGAGAPLRKSLATPVKGDSVR